MRDLCLEEIEMVFGGDDEVTGDGGTVHVTASPLPARPSDYVQVQVQTPAPSVQVSLGGSAGNGKAGGNVGVSVNIPTGPTVTVTKTVPADDPSLCVTSNEGRTVSCPMPLK